MAVDQSDNKALEVSSCREKVLTEAVRRAPRSLERALYHKHAWPYGPDAGEKRGEERRKGRASGTDLELGPRRNFPKVLTLVLLPLHQDRSDPQSGEKAKQKSRT